MKVKEAMTKSVKTIRSNDTVRDAAIVMNKYRIGALVVISGSGSVDGIITERDIMSDIVAEGLKSDDVKVSEIMTPKEKMIMITPTASLEEAAEAMTTYGIKKLPVVDKGELVGIITASDLIAYEEKLIERVSQLLTFPKKKQNIGG